MKHHRLALTVALTTLLILGWASAVGASEANVEAPMIDLEIESLLIEPAKAQVSSASHSPAVASAAHRLDFSAFSCPTFCVFGGRANATASATTCPKAKRACFRKAGANVSCPGGDVCQETFVRDSCITKPNGNKRVECHVEWSCTETICP